MERFLVKVSVVVSLILQGCSAIPDYGFLHTTTTTTTIAETNVIIVPLQRVTRGSVSDYVVDVKFESSNGSQTLQVVVDTGSSVLAVAASPSLPGNSFYSGGQCDGASVFFDYAAGKMNGNVCNIPPEATVSLGGLAAGKPSFMGIKEWAPTNDTIAVAGESLPSPIHEPVILSNLSRGILGMAFESLSAAMDPAFTANRVAPLFDSISEGNNMSNIFGLQYCGSAGGRMTLGGVDQTLFTGTIQYTPITCRTLFCVNITRVGTSISGMLSVDTYYGKENPFSPGTFVDSGSPYLQLEFDAYANISAVINQRAIALGIANPSDSVVSMGCSFKAWQQLNFSSCACVTQADVPHLPEIWLELSGGVILKIPSSKYLAPQSGSKCMAVLVTAEILGGGVIGVPALESYYTVFDKDHSRVGFAPLAGCPAQ